MIVQEEPMTTYVETFDFLEFTLICARTRKNNRFTVWCKTIAKRLRARIKAVRKEIK